MLDIRESRFDNGSRWQIRPFHVKPIAWSAIIIGPLVGSGADYLSAVRGKYLDFSNPSLELMAQVNVGILTRPTWPELGPSSVLKNPGRSWY